MSNRENVVGFQFGPIRRNTRPSTDSDSSWESCDEDIDQEEVASRVDVAVSMWCKCGKCKEMPSEPECLCCCELESANIFNLIDNCITEHENFHSIILLKEVLWTALVGMHDTNASHLPRRENVTNKTYRYASYRQFTWWVHNRIGRVRRVIPSCVVNKIRDVFPEPNGVYVGYKDGEPVPEIDIAWALREEEELD